MLSGGKGRVVLYGRPEQRPGLAALHHGAATLGLRCSALRPTDRWVEADRVPDAALVVLDGWKGRAPEVTAAYRAAGVPVYVLELPRLRGAACGPDGQDYGTLWGLYAGGLADLPLRVGNVVHAGGVLRRWRPEYVLLCGQRPGDAAHGMDAAACARWAAETAGLAAVQYNLPVCWRPHPRGLDVAAPPGVARVSLPAEEPLREALAGAAALVTHNSTAGLEAVDAGVPAHYTADPAAVFWRDYGSPLGAPARVLSYGERRAALLRAGASQWSTTQLADGTALACLLGMAAWPEPVLVEAEPHPARVGSVLAAAGPLLAGNGVMPRRRTAATAATSTARG
jgi:hypothetical protein